MDPEKTGFSEKETAAIIKRALELQHRGGAGQSESGPGAGLATLEEIQRIGLEVGIRPELIQRAAEELADGQPKSYDVFWLGAAVVQKAQSDVAGSKRALADLIPVIEQAAECDGKGALTENSLQWRSRHRGTLVHVRKETDGRIKIRTDVRLGDVAVSLFPSLIPGLGLGAGLGVGFGVGLPVLHSPLFMILFPAGMLAASFLLARSIFKAVARSAASRAKRIVDAVRRALQGG